MVDATLKLACLPFRDSCFAEKLSPSFIIFFLPLFFPLYAFHLCHLIHFQFLFLLLTMTISNIVYCESHLHQKAHILYSLRVPPLEERSNSSSSTSMSNKSFQIQNPPTHLPIPQNPSINGPLSTNRAHSMFFFAMYDLLLNVYNIHETSKQIMGFLTEIFPPTFAKYRYKLYDKHIKYKMAKDIPPE